MAFSGGTFSRLYDWTTDRDNGVKILASRMDQEFDGMATGLSTCILKDGTQTCTAAIPFAQGITLPDNKTITLGTNSDITIQYDESTNDSLEIAANVEGAALGIVLKADQGDDNADQHKVGIADGGTLTFGSKISGSFVTYLTHTPNSTVASSTTAVAGNLTVGGDLTLGSGAVISEAELEKLDGITNGTVAANKAVVVDANKDISSFRNVTLTGELDAGSLDISGDADIDGTLEADAMTLNGTAITATATLDTGISNNNVPKFTSGVADDDFLRVAGTAIEGRSAAEVLSDISAAPAAGSSNIVTTGALDSGSITSGFGSIDNGASAITTTGVITGGTLEATTDTAAGDNAAIGYTSAEGLILTGQGSTSDITLKNDADATVFTVPTGTDDILFPDNAKILMGNSSDLSIYHDSSNSYISEQGTGNLNVLGTSIEFLNSAANKYYLAMTDGGSLTAYHNGSAKVATTATGCDISGVLTTQTSSTSTSAFDFGVQVNNSYASNDSISAIGFHNRADVNSTGVGGAIAFNGGGVSGGSGNITFNIKDNSNIANVVDVADEKMRLTSGGNLNVGKTADGIGTAGLALRGDVDIAQFTRSGGEPLELNRLSNDGALTIFYKDGTQVGQLASKDGEITVGSGDVGLRFYAAGDAVIPVTATNQEVRDNAIDLGGGSFRFQDIFATNGTIQTSDANEKQQIAALTDAEMTAAKAISQLFKTFKWNDSVAEKGDAARIHTGYIAQDIQAAMTAAGLDAADYAFWCSDTWWETQTEVAAVEAVDEVLDDDGNVVTEAVEAVAAYTRTDTYQTAEEAPEGATERTRLGIRYPELLAFVGAATEQRLGDIETRLAALEA